MGRIPHRPGGPWTGILLAASVLGSCLQPAPAQTPVTIVLTPPSPVVGGGVSLAPQPPPENLVLCSWYRSATTDPNSLILSYFQYPNPVQNNGPAHTGRETLGPSCALHIAGLTLSDTGNYTVLIQILTATNPVRSTVVLRVSEKLAKPTVTPGQTQVPENGTLTLTCNTSPSADTVLWLQNGSYLTPNTRLELSSENRTLTVLNFTWGDTGTYQCEVGNPVSTNRSEPSNVTVVYGPDSARIEPPELLPRPLGSLVSLTCVSESVPAPRYRWVLNSTELKETGSSLTLNLTSLDQQGTYMCQAQNPITNLTKNSTTLVIQVLEILPKPTVTPNQTQVLENGTFTLTCNSSTSADTVLWLRDGASLVPSERLRLSPDNRTLTVPNVIRGDAGAYQCEVRNPVSTNRSEPSNVTVAYGPDSAKIDQSGSITLGSPLTLTCVADSVPAPSYRWVLNGTDAKGTGSSLTINSITQDHQGTYTCQAHNPITNLTASASVDVRLTSPPDSNGGLPPGAIAGIVIGSLAGAALLGVLLYFLLRKTGGGPKQHPPVGGQAAPAPNQGVCDNKPTLGDEDIQYSTLAFTAGDQKPPPGPEPPRESGTVYSEIRKK